MNTESQAIRITKQGLSKKTKVDYSNVNMNEMRIEVLKDTLKYLGKKRFNDMKANFQQQFVEAKQILTFGTFQFYLSIAGISGFSVCLMLALEMGLENNITDFDEVMNDWLDSRNDRKSAKND